MNAKPTVLIVEDEKPMARALELKLTKVGFNVKVAYNGEEALDIVGKEKVDLMLLDLIMPKKDGFGVLSELKQKGVTVPVVVSSNLSQEEDFQRAKSLGAKGYFVKSNTPIAEIVTIIKNSLGI